MMVLSHVQYEFCHVIYHSGLESATKVQNGIFVQILDLYVVMIRRTKLALPKTNGTMAELH
jgi:hypothetical protein